MRRKKTRQDLRGLLPCFRQAHEPDPGRLRRIQEDEEEEDPAGRTRGREEDAGNGSVEGRAPRFNER